MTTDLHLDLYTLSHTCIIWSNNSIAVVTQNIQHSLLSLSFRSTFLQSYIKPILMSFALVVTYCQLIFLAFFLT